ncbi:MAG: hypothetical protein WED10_11670 [Brumimicrobium sp.]
MATKYTFLIWLFLYPALALSQNGSVPSNQIKLSAEQLINPTNWGVKLSYERSYLLNRLSTEIGGTILIPYSSDYRQNGFRTHVSQKYFYYRKGIHQYVGVGYEYQLSSFSDVDYFTDSTLAEFPYKGVEDEYTGQKELHIVNLLWGFQIIKNHFVFEFGGGIGIKYRNVEHFDRANPDYEMVRPRHPNFNYSSMVESEGFHINFPITVKIGYVF